METPERPTTPLSPAGEPPAGAPGPTPDRAAPIGQFLRQKAGPLPTLAPGLGGWAIAMMGLTVGILGLMCYSFYWQGRSRQALEAQIKKGEETLQVAIQRIADHEAKLAEVASLLDTLGRRTGITQKELQSARALAQQIKQEQERTFKEIDTQIAQKADAEQLTRIKQEAETKLGAVSTDVSTVRGDVTNVRSEVASARQELQSTRRELLDVHEQLRTQVAKNYSELADLRRKGERDFYDFDIGRKNSFQKVGDVNVALKRADPKKRRYDVLITVDDNRLEKKDRAVNEPIQFLVGKDRQRYELVVFTVGKDRITGYLSTPKRN